MWIYKFNPNPPATLQPSPFSSTNSTSDLMCQSDLSQYPSPNFVCAPAATAHASGGWVVSKQPGNARWFKMASLEVTDYPLKGHGFFTIPKSRSRIESPAYRSSCFNFIVSIVSQIFQKLQQNIIWESLTFPTKWAQSQQLKECRVK